ncbi:hypothetical protein OQA88_11804 [Cercophora sp. LCS_1]
MPSLTSRLHSFVFKTPHQCGACLFPLPPTAETLSFDINPSRDLLFETSDSRRVEIAQLTESAERGCEKCATIRSFISGTGITCSAIEWWLAMGGSRPRVTAHSESGEEVELEICSSTLRLKETDTDADDNPNNDVDINTNIDTDNKTGHPCVSAGSKLRGGTGGDEALGLARGWLERCQLEHGKCQGGAGRAFVPTRLLYIGGEELDVVVLREGLSGPVRYAALSHRWSAETERVCLLGENFEHRKAVGVALSEMPKMMRDAILVSRKLGIEFVWIDSLCIIQNSKEDWLTEAAMMAGVYSNAELTVAATWCHGSGVSLFSGREGPKFHCVDLPGEEELFLRRSAPHFQWDNGGEDSASSEQQLWPLLRRGWVYQEQWLSRRTLHFTEHEMVWICNETTACECAWHAFGRTDDSPWTGGNLGTRSLEWAEIIQEYTGRAFTQIADRLVALAGIATEYSRIEDRGLYLCGHWRKEFPESLFWKSTGDLRPRPDMKIPSWSWASVIGDIEFDYPSEDIQPHVVDVDVSYHGKDLMGDVAEGMLRISGSTVQGKLYHGDEWTEVLEASGLLLPESRGYGLEVDGRLLTFRPDYLLQGENGPGDSDDYFVASGSSALCLLFGRCTHGSFDPDSPDSNVEVEFASGLVFRALGEGSGRAERIGYFTGWDLDDGIELKRFTELASKKEFIVV